MKTLTRGENTEIPTTSLTLELKGVSQGTVDVLIFQLGADEKVRADSDLVFFNQPESPEGAVRISGASATVDLQSVPEDVRFLRVAIALDDAAQGNLALVKGLGVEVRDQAGTWIISDAVGLTTERAAVLVEIYRRGSSWKIRNVSAGWDLGLAALVTTHGVAVDDDPRAAKSDSTAQPPRTTAPTRPPARGNGAQIVLEAFPVKKTFTVNKHGSAANYNVPKGFEMLHLDVEHMFEVALDGTGIDPEHTWWELSVEPDDVVDEYTVRRVAFAFTPGHERPPYGIRVTFAEDGMTREHGYRKDLDFPEWRGGVGTGPCELKNLAFDLRLATDNAIKDGYQFEGPWMFRVIEDSEEGKLLEAFSAASWTKPKRWRVAPA